MFYFIWTPNLLPFKSPFVFFLLCLHLSLFSVCTYRFWKWNCMDGTTQKSLSPTHTQTDTHSHTPSHTHTHALTHSLTCCRKKSIVRLLLPLVSFHFVSFVVGTYMFGRARAFCGREKGTFGVALENEIKGKVFILKAPGFENKKIGLFEVLY